MSYIPAVWQMFAGSYVSCWNTLSLALSAAWRSWGNQSLVSRSACEAVETCVRAGDAWR